MHVQPYLDFNGRCDEALEFYKTAVGAEVAMLMRWKTAPTNPCVRQKMPTGDALAVSNRR